MSNHQEVCTKKTQQKIIQTIRILSSVFVFHIKEGSKIKNTISLCSQLGHTVTIWHIFQTIKLSGRLRVVALK